jgi:hypothetical protein
MPVIFETAIRLVLPMPGMGGGSFCPEPVQGQGHQSVQRQSSDFAFELREEDRAEANVVVPVVGGVVVPISRPTILGTIVPAPATNHTVRTHD